MVLRDEADPREERVRIVAGLVSEHAQLAVVGLLRPTARFSSVVFPAPFGPTSAVTDPAGISSVQSLSAHVDP